MPLYFAYGSNMHRARLEARVGAVADFGACWLAGWVHAFDKRGADGTAKGNLRPRAGAHACGVLYGLSEPQWTALRGFEGGYRTEGVGVRRGAAIAVARTFVGVVCARGLAPTEAYLEHYRRGIAEHALPVGYLARILARAGGGHD